MARREAQSPQVFETLCTLVSINPEGIASRKRSALLTCSPHRALTSVLGRLPPLTLLEHVPLVSGSTTNGPPMRGAPFAARLIEAAGDASSLPGLRFPRRIGDAA